MKISIVAVGKIKEVYLKDGMAEYQKRLSRYCTLDMIEVEDESAPESLHPAQEIKIKQVEGERLLKAIRKGSYVIALDVKGRKMTSNAFSHQLSELGVRGHGHISFVIGGSLGLSKELLAFADETFSMSDLTFPHQLARLVLIEQIYRAFKISRGEAYHK